MKRIFLPFYQKALSNLHELRVIFFELTHRCNLACLHCGSDCIKDAKTPDLPEESILKTLNEVRSKYDPHKIIAILSGGEPLCYPGVFDLGRKIYEMEFPWGMVTNGYGWTKGSVRAAESSGLQSITVSLDGFAGEHNWLRGKKDSFNRAVKTIQMLVKNPFYQFMDIITCVNKRNLEKLDDFCLFIRDLGVRQWRLFIVSPIGRATQHAELFLSGGEFKLLLEKILEFREENEMNINLSESGYLGSEYENKVRDKAYFCPAGIGVAGVMVNGDILACPNIDRRFKQGNINSDSFVDTWEKKFQVFRNRSWMKMGDCRSCKEWKLCKGNSFHLWDIDNNCTRLCHYKLLGNAT